MDGVVLHRLGRRLVELSRAVTTEAGPTSLTPAQVAVVEDVLKHPDSTINEIRARTGFVQSSVSVSVSRLVALGLLQTAADPADLRRTRVRLTTRTRRAILRRAARPVDEVLRAEAIDPRDTARVIELLDELAALLAV